MGYGLARASAAGGHNQVPAGPFCVILGLVESLERLVVHVEEAVRLGTMNDDPHLRLGLMMLDSAAELLLHRECDSRLRLAGSYRELVSMSEWWRATMGKELSSAAGLREKAVPAAQCKRIDRDFGAKCDYLVGIGVLAEPHARVLKKLHKYRNEAYHRDKLRLGTLASATRIYVYLACTLMRDFPSRGTGGVIFLTSCPPAGIVKYLDEEEDWVSLVLDRRRSAGLQARIASRLFADAGAAVPSRAGEVLSRHLCHRLDAVREAAGDAASFFSWPGRDEGWDWEAALSLAQLDLPGLPSSGQARSADVPVRPEHIRRWLAAGEAIAEQPDDLAAFASFADLEDAFEPVEAQVMQLLTEVEVQADLASGK
jgi:hypothetical protein